MQTLISTYGEVTVNNGNVTANDGNVTIDRPHRSVKHTYFYTAKNLKLNWFVSVAVWYLYHSCTFCHLKSLCSSHNTSMNTFAPNYT